MRISISNIAWDAHEDSNIAQLLMSHQIDAIDIAPGKYFPNIPQTTPADIQRVKKWWHHHGIEITGMQALLFGTQGLNLFGDLLTQQAMLDHLSAVCRIAAELSASRLVFGSPKNRNRDGLTDLQAEETALNFFHRLGKIAQSYGVMICLEPNPAKYNCNFMTTSTETAAIVRKVSLPAIKMQLDTGALTINHEDPGEIVKQHADIIGHIHISEPDLVPLGDGSTRHDHMASALSQPGLPRLVAIETLAPTAESHIIAIERSLKIAARFYKSLATTRFSDHE